MTRKKNIVDRLREHEQRSQPGPPPGPQPVPGDVWPEEQRGDAWEPPAAARVEGEPWEPPIPLNTLPPTEPFPLDALPLPLREFVGEVAWATNSPPDFTAMFCLGVAASAIGNSRVLAITRTHLQPASLYLAVVGGPGSGKTPALEHAREPLDAAEQRYMAQWVSARDEWLEDDPESRGAKPVLRRVVVDDTTTEALVRTLAENARGVGMVRDELSALFTGMNQYRDGGKGHDRQIYLKIWSRSKIQVDRRGTPDAAPVTVRRPCVTIVGGIQPDVIDWVRGERVGTKDPPDDGFLDRFLVAFPAGLPAVEEQWREVTETASHSWDRIVSALLDVPLHPERDGGERPYLMLLSSSGRDAWVQFTRGHAAEVNDPEFPRHLRGVWAKMLGYCGRLALVLQMLRVVCGTGQEKLVEGHSVEAAAQLVRYFKAHAMKVRALMGIDPRLASARHVLDYLARKSDLKTFSRRDLYVDLRRTFGTPEELLAPLRLLTEYRFLRQQPAIGHSGPGRKPSERYEVNPLWERHVIHRIHEMPP